MSNNDFPDRPDQTEDGRHSKRHKPSHFPVPLHEQQFNGGIANLSDNLIALQGRQCCEVKFTAECDEIFQKWFSHVERSNIKNLIVDNVNNAAVQQSFEPDVAPRKMLTLYKHEFYFYDLRDSGIVALLVVDIKKVDAPNTGDKGTVHWEKGISVLIRIVRAVVKGLTSNHCNDETALRLLLLERNLSRHQYAGSAPELLEFFPEVKIKIKTGAPSRKGVANAEEPTNRVSLMMVEIIALERRVERDVVFDAVEAALAQETRKLIGGEVDIRVAMDRETGCYEAFRRWQVVSNETCLLNGDTEILLSQAQKLIADIQVYDYLEEAIDSVGVVRVKDMLLQRILGAEREFLRYEIPPVCELGKFGGAAPLRRGVRGQMMLGKDYLTKNHGARKVKVLAKCKFVGIDEVDLCQAKGRYRLGVPSLRVLGTVHPSNEAERSALACVLRFAFTILFLFVATGSSVLDRAYSIAETMSLTLRRNRVARSGYQFVVAYSRIGGQTGRQTVRAFDPASPFLITVRDSRRGSVKVLTRFGVSFVFQEKSQYLRSRPNTGLRGAWFFCASASALWKPPMFVHPILVLDQRTNAVPYSSKQISNRESNRATAVVNFWLGTDVSNPGQFARIGLTLRCLESPVSEYKSQVEENGGFQRWDNIEELFRDRVGLTRNTPVHHRTNLQAGDVSAQACAIKATRQKLGMTQEQFAATFGLSVASLRDWEQGTRVPEAPVALYFRLIDNYPEKVKLVVASERTFS